MVSHVFCLWCRDLVVRFRLLHPLKLPPKNIACESRFRYLRVIILLGDGVLVDVGRVTGGLGALLRALRLREPGIAGLMVMVTADT